MFKYEKTLEYPVNVKKKDLRMAKLLVDQLGGPSGELGACLRYLLQRFTMPDDKGKTLLTDIGKKLCFISESVKHRIRRLPLYILFIGIFLL